MKIKFEYIILIIATAFTIGVVICLYNQTQVIIPEVGVQRIGPAEAYPHQDTQPGKLSNLDYKQTCENPFWRTSSIRPPSRYTTSLKITQLNSGYAYQGDLNTKDYEEDHIISLELCGDPEDPSNLWPEPYTLMYNGENIGAKTKDLVENALHKELINNQISVQQAAQIISSDWYACWLKIKSNQLCL